MKPEDLADKINGAVAEYLDRPEVLGEFQKIVDSAVLAERLAERERCEKRINEDVDWHPGEELLRAAVINAIRNDK